MASRKITHGSLCALGALASTDATKRVPTQTASAPYDSVAVRPLPSKIPPAAINGICWPVRGLFAFEFVETSGNKNLIGATKEFTTRVNEAQPSDCSDSLSNGRRNDVRKMLHRRWDASPPWAQNISIPTSGALAICFGCPIIFITGMLAA